MEFTSLLHSFRTELWVIFEILLASAAGAIIGWDREKKNRPAGIRTHIFVTASAALFVGVGFSFPMPEGATSDPLRVMEALITGVSFLGAGTIFKSSSGGVEGITTAASLLFTSAIGLAIGLNQFVLAAFATFFGWIILKMTRITG